MNNRHKARTVTSVNRGFGDVVAGVVLTALMLFAGATSPSLAGSRIAVVTTYAARAPRGVLVTSGGFGGATCDATANAATLASIATSLGRPVSGWVTRSRHGVTFWRSGTRLVEGQTVGVKVVFVPGGAIPPGAVCG